MTLIGPVTFHNVCFNEDSDDSVNDPNSELEEPERKTERQLKKCTLTNVEKSVTTTQHESRVIDETGTKKEKKIIKQKSEWKKNVVKILRNSGKAYRSSKSSKIFLEHSLKSPCKDTCTFKCQLDIGINQQKNEAYKRLQQRRTRSTLEDYENLRREEKRMFRRKKKEQYEHALNEIVNYHNGKDIRKFYQQINSCRKDFKPRIIISMHILSSVHSLTLSLSRVLQSENQDLGEAIELADAAKQVLLERRENAEKDFRGIFKTVSEISAKYDIELRKPRLASKQTQRSNVQTDSVQDYFRITIYIPYIDLFLTHIQDRFLNHRKILSNFACLFPNKMKNFNEESCAQLFEPYSSILRDDSRDIWVDEVKLWRQRIAGKNVKNSLEALDVCNGDAFPNVHQMLRILAVLPVTTATNERSFSTLRRLKTYLRSTMSEDRLNGLASLNIHRDVEVDPQRVLEKFFSTPRRVNLLNNN
ncbi:52 kDa repressor of the inhibitor of the protein kinase-like [Diabrotica virgifera virgifera]|uniref:HAT C-terminal dimerisation domain-containing protein n=1 Tax=Diabrotica virgifera virgifera TaxID=50390 RepID=A0ABM5L128_DIAVI|nr:52 kDa repressor of the inhibitor of the protein kinase-like [Diabrotica virgifera virgifera]